MCNAVTDLPEILSTRQMRAAEAAAIASGQVSGLQLMERAAGGVVARILSRWPETAAARRAVVLCGPGNNGGDGYVVARLLAARGWQVRLAALAPPASADARRAAGLWPGPVATLADLSLADFDGDCLCIDALFGTGLARPLPPAALAALRLAAAQGSAILAVDLLSGLCADSGRVLGGLALPAAALSVSFHRAKPGHFLAEGGTLSGALHVVDIGLAERSPGSGPRTGLAGPGHGLAKCGGHKYDHGHALILGGGPGRGGAARLAARGALRVGAGLVTLALPGAALPENAARLDAVMLAEIDRAADLDRLLADHRLNALCLGPGLGVDRAHELLPVALAADRATVLDADALSALPQAPGWPGAGLHPGVILTPHGGEFARLFPDLAARLAAPADSGPAFSRLDAVRQAAARAQATVLLKGPDTVIAAPDGTARIAAAVAEMAAPWLATAGSGDVLAGIIAGLLARGFAPLDAAATGAWLHAEAARRFGPGLISEDLPEAIPGVLRGLAG
ncbi:NAD(P)H-hydrate dehydratase [Paracoccus sp. (in: a-proteobacteria)]|uniref:NAD(P)H-hydrate dehydratase n=1 Tax=Paracoccus sp. TaxID=267 RepID=UPI0032201669